MPIDHKVQTRSPGRKGCRITDRRPGWPGPPTSAISAPEPVPGLIGSPLAAVYVGASSVRVGK